MNISLHPEKGLNPKLTRCPQCGKDGQEILLIGNHDYVTECPECHIRLIGGGECPRCSHRGGRGKVYGVNRKPLDEVYPGNTLPGSICEECEKKNEETREAVEAGGIYWKCADCGSAGAIRAGHPLALAVREKMSIEPPNPCGIEFTKAEGCPVCSEQAVKPDEEKP